MVDDAAQIGVTDNPIQAMTPDEELKLKGAVRESIRQQVLQIISTKHVVLADAMRCPGCGQHVIYLDEPATFVLDNDSHEQICAACGAERDFVKLFRQETDIGGEGGA